ncbi:MAG: thioredoxin family protein [Actinomycetota bacterium]
MPASAEILYFTGASCRICSIMTPLVEEVADDFDARVAFTPLDSARHSKRASAYNVMAVPTIVALADGEEIGRAVGAQTPGALKRLFSAAESGEPPKSVMNPRDRMLRIGFAIALAVLAVTTGQPAVWIAVAAALIAAFWDHLRR